MCFAETALDKVIHGKGCRQVGVHHPFHQQSVRIKKFLSQPGEVHLPFYPGLDRRILKQVGHFGLHIQRGVKAFHRELFERNERRIGERSVQMDIQVHFQCVDALFDILDMIGAVFYLATQVYVRYDTVP